MRNSGVQKAVYSFSWIPLCLTLSWAFLAGCITPRADVPEPASLSRPRVEARYTATPIRVDGILDEAAWQEAESYSLFLSRADVDRGQSLREPGTVRFCWDQDFLYVAIDFQDSDVVAEGQEDNERHFLLGDVAEVFLKPGADSYYWELYVTPHQLRSTFFFPSRGRILPSVFEHQFELPVAAHIRGTLNDWSDTDQGWTAEMAIPIRELESHGATFGPGNTWQVLVGRYNYGKNFSNAELSSMPELSLTSFHLHEEYAELILLE